MWWSPRPKCIPPRRKLSKHALIGPYFDLPPFFAPMKEKRSPRIRPSWFRFLVVPVRSSDLVPLACFVPLSLKQEIFQLIITIMEIPLGYTSTCRPFRWLIIRQKSPSFGCKALRARESFINSKSTKWWTLCWGICPQFKKQGFFHLWMPPNNLIF